MLKLLTLHEAAELLRVPDRRLRDYWRTWGITGVSKVGRELRFRERDLWAHVDRHPAS